MINLLPPELKEQRRYGRKNTALFGYSLALLATGALTAGIMIAGLQFIATDEPTLKAEIEATQAQINLLEKDINAVELVATRLETAKAIDETSVKFSELIPKIGAVLPDGVILNALSLTGGKTDPLKLDVDLKSADLGPIMIRNLTESDLFEAADIATLTPTGSSEEATSSAYQFKASITASFTGTAEATRKAAAAEAAKKAAAEAAAAEQKTGAQ